MGTLTFAPEWYSSGVVDGGRSAWLVFKDRLREQWRKETGQRCALKLVALPELGEKHGRLHVHFLAFGVPASWCDEWTEIRSGKVYSQSRFRQLVARCWELGFEQGSAVENEGGVRYAFKYLAKGRRGHLEARREWARRSDACRRAGLAAPSFESGFWFYAPRGREGGLGARWADQLAERMRPQLEPGAFDVPPVLRRGKPLALSRYERRRLRVRLGLDGPAHRAMREALSPENAEMAFRVESFGGDLRALAARRGHADDDVARLRAEVVRVAEQFGGRVPVPAWRRGKR